MKKTMTLLLSIALLGTCAFSIFSNNKVMEVKADEQRIEYVDIGPGVFNPLQDNTSINQFNPSVYSIALRDNALMVFPNENIYKDIPFNKIIKQPELVDTDLSNIRVYTSEDTYHTLDYYLVSFEAIKYNIYSDAAINVSFFLRPGALTPKDIYKITFNEGFVLPYPLDSHDVKYVVKETMSFYYNSYQKDDAPTDIFYSFEWNKVVYTNEKEEGSGSQEVDGIEIVPIAAFARTNADYRLQIRGSNVTEEDFTIEGALDTDDGTCRLIIFFGNNDYNPNLNSTSVEVNPSKFDISEENENSYLHTLYERVILKTPQGESMTLKEASDPKTKGLPIYNVFGEMGSLSFLIGNNGKDNLVSYNALSFSSVTVLKGAEFPSFDYTNGPSKKELRYSQMDDITVDLSSYRQALWATNAEYSFTAANITIESLSSRHVNISEDDFSLDATVIDIKLEQSNYQGLKNKEIIAIGENLSKYIYVNGRALFYAYDESDIKAFANLGGLEDTISIVVPEKVEDITEIIVRRGCSVPSANATPTTIKIYGSCVSFFVNSSVSFELKNGSFVKSDKIYWTLWFEGKNPVRVANASTYDFDTAPEGDSTPKQRFLYWVDEEGNEMSGYVRVMSGKEYTGVYAYSYDVTFNNIDDEFSIIVERYTRLTKCEDAKKALNPTRKGYVFQGYVDEEGNHYNLDNRVLRDIVLTAIWIKVDTVETTQTSSNSCGGNIIMTNITISLISLLGFILLSYKYIKEKKK